MSIINDALKKVQTNLNDTEEKKKARKSRTSEPKTTAPDQEPAQPSFDSSPSIKKEITGQNTTTQAPQETTTSAHTNTSSTTPASQYKRENNHKRRFSCLGLGFTIIPIGIAIAATVYFLRKEPIPEKNISVPVPLRVTRQEHPPKKATKKRILFQKASIKKQHPQEQETPNIKINGIMELNGKYVALINNEIYERGDVVSGMKLLAISLDSIHVDIKGERKVFRIKK
ncbi:MAG: hypothetical protein KAJ18_10460 [Candidatus Omnitrophica bacterium]|nr:hypothetical protein [Candidatus Omnitrophota bacterium]